MTSPVRQFRRSAPGHGADDEERLPAADDGFGQRRIGGFVREIFLAGEEAEERTALAGRVIADRPPERRVPRFECVEKRAPRHRRRDLDLDLSVDACQRPQVRRERHPDHRSVCASTDSTAGRSRTIADQLSPESFEA